MNKFIHAGAVYRTANPEIGDGVVNSTDYTALIDRVKLLAPRIVKQAQKILDEWEQDEEGWDEYYGYGGACGEIEREAIAAVLMEAGIDTMEGGQEGDDHAWAIAYDTETKEAVAVDIPHSCYEQGSGYSWRKLHDVSLRPEDVVVDDINYDDVIGPNEEYLDY